ncbi:unnamed protein product, partial [Ectocarpus sp. 12 AP-2014]
WGLAEGGSRCGEQSWRWRGKRCRGKRRCQGGRRRGRLSGAWRRCWCWFHGRCWRGRLSGREGRGWSRFRCGAWCWCGSRLGCGSLFVLPQRARERQHQEAEGGKKSLTRRPHGLRLEAGAQGRFAGGRGGREKWAT